MKSKELEELAQFLCEDVRPEIRALSFQSVLGLTGTDHGCRQLAECGSIVQQLHLCCRRYLQQSLARSACSATSDCRPPPCVTPCSSPSSSPVGLVVSAVQALVNIVAVDGPVAADTASRLFLLSAVVDVDAERPLCQLMLHCACVEADASLLQAASMLMSNVTRYPAVCCRVIERMRASTSVGATVVTLRRLVAAMRQTERAPLLYHMTGLLANVAQHDEGRKMLMEDDAALLECVAEWIGDCDSEVRRQAAATVVRNCCLGTADHDVILSERSDLLPHLLLPLAAGGEHLPDGELTYGQTPDGDDDIDPAAASVPPQLQFLPDDKQREPLSDIRLLLLESLMQLCATRAGRRALRARGVYVVLRSYHKWEQHPDAVTACEQLVNMLLQTEHEIGVDNLKDLKVDVD